MPFTIASYDSCGFCSYIRGEKEYVALAEDALALALMNYRQYERGAMLVIPKRHCETVLDVSDAELASLYRLAKALARGAELALGACGANIYQNNGIKAGQHVPHVHVHVVPRYQDSDSAKLFLQDDYPILPLDELRAAAAAIRATLRPTSIPMV
jgi:histidine triad (HIT) family protein